MAGGRPTKYDPAFCDRVIELGDTGASIAEMAYECGVCRNTLKAWMDEHEEFLTAITRATLASQVWWERAGRVGMIENNISAPIWSRSMAARFPDDWREIKGTELTGRNGEPVQFNGLEVTIVDPAKT